MNKPTVAISQDFMMAFAKIPKAQQKKVIEFVTKFRYDPRSPGINYERINDARDASFRSVRIDQAYRGIILKPDQGDVFVLLWVDKHDDAYSWATKHTCQVHPETGTLQVFETQAAEQPAVIERPELELEAPPAPVPSPVAAPIETEEHRPPLFELTETELLSLGVPSDLVSAVQDLSSEEQLEAMEKQLPVEAFEAIYLFAAGTPWEDIEQEYAAKKETPVDPTDIAAALERPESQRSFYVVEDELELHEMLQAPLERWRVFLHPSQRKLVDRRWNGPVRVLGGAGTGKTVVAMHRARWLAKHVLAGADERILFTTFTANLATDIEQNLKKICRPEELERVEVKHIDRWVSEFLRRNKYPHRIVYEDRDKDYGDIWDLSLQLAPTALGLPETFYKEEWQRVILPQRVMTKPEYFKASRAGRGVPLSRKQRAEIWPIFEELRVQLHQKGLRPFEDATLDAIDILRSQDIRLPYRSVVVDEAQDMGPQALTLIRHLVPEQPDDLFIVGDGHQRIYRRKTTMGQCGIRIVGRSRKLRINYRTTEETRRFATAVLEGVSVDDLDGGEDTTNDYRSLLHGRKPEVRGFASQEAEHQWIIDQIKTLTESGIETQDICVVARTRRLRDQTGEAIANAGLKTCTLEQQQSDNRAVDGVRLATMHCVKGLEFHYMFIAGANDGVIPLRQAMSGTEDPVEARQSDLNERALLHVSATRAIRQLFVSSSGEPSPYIASETMA